MKRILFERIFLLGLCRFIGLLAIVGFGMSQRNSMIPGGVLAASAQVIPDTSLRSENSTVSQPAINTILIQGGAVRGMNLFHSFSAFSVGEGQTARFSPAAGIQAIFSRVTGGGRSQILGTVRVDGDASLFLINPSGIVFGKNARLDLRGSFVATTADGIVFPNGDRFSAIQPDVPSALLTVQPSALFVNQLAVQPITVNGRLTVADGKTLALAGGEIQLDGATLQAFGGRVELGGLAAPGVIGLGEGDFHLSVPVDVGRANALINRSSVDVRAGGGGAIAIQVQNLKASGSALSAGVSRIATRAVAGDITLDATGDITLSQGSNVSDGVSNRQLGTQVSGTGGRIVIRANSLSLQSRAQLSTSTVGRGNAGNIDIQVADAMVLGEGTGVRSLVQAGAIGNGGTIQIQARSLALQNGAQIAGSVLQSGIGDGGNISITVNDTVTIAGVNPTLRGTDGTPFPSGLLVNNETVQAGNAGDITVRAAKLLLSDGGRIEASTTIGNGGNITLTAQDYILLRRNSLISTTAGTVGAGGNGGNIMITAPFVIGVLSENSDIRANAFTGNGGRINITAQGIYGLRSQPRDTPFSDITASSQFGLSGVVTLNTLNLDPSRGLVTLPINLTDPAAQIAAGCSSNGTTRSKNHFVVTGRGGVPTSPDEMFDGDRALVGLVAVAHEEVKSEEDLIFKSGSLNTPAKIQDPKSSQPIVEMQSWLINSQGEVTLVADGSAGIPHSDWRSPTRCPASH